MKMRIGLDFMGGDFAPIEPLKGAIEAQEAFGTHFQVVLFGDEAIGRVAMQELGGNPEDFEWVHCTEVITFNDHPTKAVSQKPDSSIVKGFGFLKARQTHAFISAGNTGAMMVGAIYSIKPIEGVIRPGITTVIPKVSGKFGIMLDVGANADCRPDVLYQFGLLGSLFCQNVYQIENPKVGLLNIGEEKEKGNLVTKEAYQLMEDNQRYHFIGNIEGRDLFLDKADVAVCDGFTGNIVLKACESIFTILKKQSVNNEYLNRFNYEDYGGTPVLGVNAPVIIGHGISSAKAFRNMFKLAENMVANNLVEKIRSSL